MSYPAGRSMKRVEREQGSDRGESDPLLSGSTSSIQKGIINTRALTDEKSKGTGNIATLFSFTKASIGSGSFALPWGILQAGVLVGMTGIILLGLASVYTMQLMLEIKQYLQRKTSGKNSNLNYTEIGYIALGFFGKWAVNIAVLGCNLGVCAGYMIFISTNLQWVFNCVSIRAHHFVCFDTWEIYAILLPILILLTFLPSFRLLAYAAYVGFVFLVIALVVVYVYGIQTRLFCAVEEVTEPLRYLPKDWTGIAQWFGVTAFLFCIHSMVIPLESVMKKPRNMPILLDIAALMVVGINLPFAVYGYLLFGSQTQGYIFTNLPGNWFNTIVRAFLSIELTLTFPIVIKPASDVVEEILRNVLMFFSKKLDKRQSIRSLYENRQYSYRAARTAMVFVLRGFLVLISWSVAVGIPRFELCLALVGSLTTTVLAFILPPLFHLKVMWKITSLPKKVFHMILLIVGILVTISATAINLYMAIKGGGAAPDCGEFNSSCTTEYSNEYGHCLKVLI